MRKSLADKETTATPRSPCSNAWTRDDGATVECGFEHPADQSCPAVDAEKEAGAKAEADRIATSLATIWIEPDSRHLPSPVEFDPYDRDTWPDGLWSFVKSDCPSKEEIIEAYFACLEERERNLRMIVLRRQIEGVKSVVEQMLCPDCHGDVCAVVDDVIQECPSCARRARIREQAEAIALAGTLSPAAAPKDPNDVFTPETGAIEFDCSEKTMQRIMCEIRDGKRKGGLLRASRAQILEQMQNEKTRGNAWHGKQSSRGTSTGGKGATRSTVGSTGPTAKRRSKSPPERPIPLPLPTSSLNTCETPAIPLPLPDDPQN